VEETIQQVEEAPVERSVKPAAQTTPQIGLVETTTTKLMQQSTTLTTTATETMAMHAAVAPTVVPVEPMPTPIAGVPSPFHAVDFCVPVGPDFSLVTGILHCTALQSNLAVEIIPFCWTIFALKHLRPYSDCCSWHISITMFRISQMSNIITPQISKHLVLKQLVD